MHLEHAQPRVAEMLAAVHPGIGLASLFRILAGRLWFSLYRDGVGASVTAVAMTWCRPWAALRHFSHTAGHARRERLRDNYDLLIEDRAERTSWHSHGQSRAALLSVHRCLQRRPL